MSDGAGKYRRLLSSAVENISNAFYDAYVEVNCRVRAMAGLKVTVIRDEIGDCCSWCKDLAGIYNYEDRPADIFARHANCRCVVTTRTEKGTYQDAWNKTEYEKYKDARIAREREIIAEQGTEDISPSVGIDVTKEYLQNATPRIGALIVEAGFIDQNGEWANAHWLHRLFGGDIILLEEKQITGRKNPDYLWRGKLWDLKSPTSSKEGTIKDRVDWGFKQIAPNPGGIIMNYSDSGLTWEESIAMTEKLIGKYGISGTDTIIRKGERFVIIRQK